MCMIHSLKALLVTVIVAAPALADTKISIEIGGSRSGNSTSAASAPSGKKGGPPPRAPAHGHRAKHTYRYFPGHDVYFEPARSMYFYLEAGAWKIGARLPDTFKIDLGASVEIGMDSDKPYQFHNEIKQAHPGRGHSASAPGHTSDDKPGKGQGKGKKKD